MSAIAWYVLALATIATVAIFLAMLLAPLEALGWWAGWYRNTTKSELGREDFPPVVPTVSSPMLDPVCSEAASHYVVFLDGIAKATPENYDDVQLLLDQLAEALPDAAVMGDVLPYSPTGTPLTRARPLAWFWRLARQRKVENSADPIGFTINFNNLLQVLVSADKRYGPIYHYGEAQRIMEGLRRHGYPSGCGIPVTLIGYSGGAQVAAGVAPYLKHLLRAPIDLISLGGVVSADPGIQDLRYVYHLAGSQDSVEKMGALMFPGRWPVVRSSSWNRAKRKGKFTYILLPGMAHNGQNGYLQVTSPGGKNHLNLTFQTIACILKTPETVHAGRVQHGPLRYSFTLPETFEVADSAMWPQAVPS